MQYLETSDYRGYVWPGANEDEDDSYPLYVCLCPGGTS